MIDLACSAQRVSNPLRYVTNRSCRKNWRAATRVCMHRDLLIRADRASRDTLCASVQKSIGPAAQFSAGHAWNFNCKRTRRAFTNRPRHRHPRGQLDLYIFCGFCLQPLNSLSAMSVTATPSKQVAESLSKIDVGASPTKAKGMKEVAKPAEETEEPVQSLCRIHITEPTRPRD